MKEIGWRPIVYSVSPPLQMLCQQPRPRRAFPNQLTPVEIWQERF